MGEMLASDDEVFVSADMMGRPVKSFMGRAGSSKTMISAPSEG